MPRHLLVYWRWADVCDDFKDPEPRHAHDASNQFFLRTHITPGDTIWYVTVPVVDGELTGQLFLFGRLKVAKIVHSTAEAQQYLSGTFHITYTVRDAQIHVFAGPDAEEPYDLVDIAALAGALRFESPNGHDRLTIHDGRVANIFELRTHRTLTPEAARLLAELWESRGHPGTPLAPINIVPVPIIEPDDEAFPEGAIKQRLHLSRERNRKLVASAKQRFKEQHGGRIFCQVCDFDFSERYGPLGDDYIEAHHTLPISDLTESATTRIEDLAMVCANCHRMLHRRRPWLKMNELRQLLR